MRDVNDTLRKPWISHDPSPIASNNDPVRTHRQPAHSSKKLLIWRQQSQLSSLWRHDACLQCSISTSLFIVEHTHTARAKYNSPACSSQSFSKLSVKCFWLAVVYISAPLCLLGIIRSHSAISSSSHATFIFLQILGRSARRLGLPRVTFRPRSESKLTNTRILNRYQ